MPISDHDINPTLRELEDPSLRFFSSTPAISSSDPDSGDEEDDPLPGPTSSERQVAPVANLVSLGKTLKRLKKFEGQSEHELTTYCQVRSSMAVL